MNRDIKFRTWDTKNKQWLQEIPPHEYMLDCEDWEHPDDMDSFTNPACPLHNFDNRLIHQQYTGLKDKNGKEIYEGDIVKSWRMNRQRERNDKSWYDVIEIGQIMWSDISHGFVENFEHLHYDDVFELSCSHRYEVIGNIFENLELLD